MTAVSDFQQIEIRHKDLFDHYFKEDPPVVSELTFTNLFIWRHQYHPVWLETDDCLLIICRPEGLPPYGLEPVGPGDKGGALDMLLGYLNEITSESSIRKVSEKFVNTCVEPDRYYSVLDQDNCDYVYKAVDLIQLSGKKYHRKKNHLNQFLKHYEFEYMELDKNLKESVLAMQERWCELKYCEGSRSLSSEDIAIHEAMIHFDMLDYKGCVIKINSRIEAFSIGEQLNSNTAVVHIEKANPDIPGLYVAVNQFFCQDAWAEVEYINREQDLGIEGLRKAKESYYPDHMVNKYIVSPIL